MPTRPAPSRSGQPIWLGLAILYVVWGSTYLGIAVAVQTIPPFLMAAARFALAGSILLAWTASRERGALVRPTRREVVDSSIIGTLLLGGGMGMVAWGEQTIPSGIAALLIAVMPVWIAVLGRAVLGERLPRLAGAGIVVGFAGVALLVGPTALGTTGALDAAGIVALMISPLAWSSGSLYASHRARLPSQPLVATGLQMLAGSVVLVGLALVSGEPGRFDPAAVSLPSVAAFAYLTIIGSIVAFTTYGWMLRVAPLPLVATYAYVNPVVAVILGALILHEPIDPRTVLAGAIIVVAVALIVTARSRMARPRGATGAPGVRPSARPGRSERPAVPAPSRSASG
jgi:drug/metabolite transporter (DMT)-like permease